MKITIEGEPKEITDLISKLQEWTVHERSKTVTNMLKCFDGPRIKNVKTAGDVQVISF